MMAERPTLDELLDCFVQRSMEVMWEEPPMSQVRHGIVAILERLAQTHTDCIPHSYLRAIVAEATRAEAKEVTPDAHLP